VSAKTRPHVLAVDDGPFEKRQSHPVPVVAVMMEGADLVESVAVTALPVDAEDATGSLAAWIQGLRLRSSAQALVLGGITIAGLGVVDVPLLSRRLRLPVLVVNRRDPADHRLGEALRAAGLEARLPLVARMPAALRIEDGLYVAAVGVEPDDAARIVRSTLRKARVPEPLRLAHLIARALVLGESRGRV
jgi:endonuclease V-like protein UPF0215 family